MGRTFPSAFRTFLPITLVVAALLGSLSLTFLMWRETDTLGSLLDSLTQENQRQLELSGEIMRLEQALSSAARQGVATGDPIWLQRYEESACSRRMISPESSS